MGIIAKWFEAATLKADYTREEVSADVYSRLGALESSMTTAESDIAALETQALGGDSLSQQAIDDIDGMKWDDVTVTLETSVGTPNNTANASRTYTAAKLSVATLYLVRYQNALGINLDGTTFPSWRQAILWVEPGGTSSGGDIAVDDRASDFLRISGNNFTTDLVEAGDIVVKRRRALP